MWVGQWGVGFLSHQTQATQMGLRGPGNEQYFVEPLIVIALSLTGQGYLTVPRAGDYKA